MMIENCENIELVGLIRFNQQFTKITQITEILGY